jgi:hypothetical protein
MVPRSGDELNEADFLKNKKSEGFYLLGGGFSLYIWPHSWYPGQLLSILQGGNLLQSKG